MDQRSALDGIAVDLLRDASVPEVGRNLQPDGKNHAAAQGNNRGNGGSYRRSIDVQIRRTMAGKDSANSSLGTMTYCHRCCKSQQIYDRNISAVAATATTTTTAAAAATATTTTTATTYGSSINSTACNNINCSKSDNQSTTSFLDVGLPLPLRNFTARSIPCLFDVQLDRSNDGSSNLSFVSFDPPRRQIRPHRSPKIPPKRATNKECRSNPARRRFDLAQGSYEIRPDSLPGPPPPLPLCVDAQKKKRKAKKTKGWRGLNVCSCGAAAADDSLDSLSGFYKGNPSAPLETSEDDLLAVSCEGRAVPKENGRASRPSGRMGTCGRFVFISFLAVLILVTVVGLLPSLVFWILSSQQDKQQPALLTGSGEHQPTSEHQEDGEGGGIDGPSHVTFSTPVTRGSQGLPLIDSDGWSSNRQSKYKTIDKPMSFYNAQEFCLKLGGHLVHINSLREQVFVEDYIMQLLRIQNLTTWETGIGFWIGARRDRGSHEGTCMFDQWKWVDPYGRALGVVAGFAAFIPGKPDNYYRPEECLFLSYKDRMDEAKFLKWDDAPCDLNSVGGIRALCEVETG